MLKKINNADAVVSELQGKILQTLEEFQGMYKDRAEFAEQLLERLGMSSGKSDWTTVESEIEKDAKERFKADKTQEVYKACAIAHEKFLMFLHYADVVLHVAKALDDSQNVDAKN